MTEFSDTTDAGSSHCVLDIFNPRNHLSENLAPKVALLKAIFHIDNTGRLTKPPPPKWFSQQVFEYILGGKVCPLPPARKARKPSIATLIKRAEKAGKAVTSITTPDGTTISFGGESTTTTAATNPWDEVLTNGADQKRPA
jgi:hypothetical protein